MSRVQRHLATRNNLYLFVSRPHRTPSARAARKAQRRRDTPAYKQRQAFMADTRNPFPRADSYI